MLGHPAATQTQSDSQSRPDAGREHRGGRGHFEGTSTQSPPFTHAADTTWGQRFEWSAPSVKAYTDPATPSP